MKKLTPFDLLLGLWVIGFVIPVYQASFAQTVITRSGEVGALKTQNTAGKVVLSVAGIGGVDAIKMDELGKVEKITNKRGLTNKPVAAARIVPPRVLYPLTIRNIAIGMARDLYAQKIQQTYFAEAFQEGFKSVLTAPHALVQMGAGQSNDPTAMGFAAGRNMAVSNSASLGITLQDYGYVYTNVVGHVFLGVEQRVFRSLGSTEIWWLAQNPELSRAYAALVRRPGSAPLQRNTVIVTVFGYLSPTRMAEDGNFGGCPRELVIDKIIEIKMDE